MGTADSLGTARSRVTPVEYAPPRGYSLDVEVIPAADLVARVAMVEGRGVERVAFHCLLVVVGGRYTHTVDFETLECGPGSCLVIHPGQVHRFGPEIDWDGWLIVLRSEFLQPQRPETRWGGAGSWSVEGMPIHVVTSGPTRDAIAEAVERMTTDAASEGNRRGLDALLRAQFELVLMRLHLVHTESTPSKRIEGIEPVVLERFRAFRVAVESEFRRWHGVAPYAAHLGCSVKSLNRSTRAVADVGPKRVIVDRIVLEAKRLLAHTSLPVSAIGDRLGFDEPTNFVKFFRRETDMTPRAFRVKQSGGPGRPG